MNSPSLDRLCIHSITTKPWSLYEAVPRYAAVGVKGITVWRQALEGRDPRGAGAFIRDHGLSIVSLCRGGFFPALTPADRLKAIDENRRCIDEAAALGAPLIVLVCGAVPGQSLDESRRQITEGIAAVLPHAAAAGVKLAIEPLHPMYAADRSAVNTMAQARAMCTALNSPWVGIAVDVYHVWWDPDLEAEIKLAGRNGTLAAFHVCDWVFPFADMLNDRGLMGEGCIDIRTIRGWVEAAGFTGFNEVEIFSNRLWQTDQTDFLLRIKQAYLNCT
ncbi:sugar phosphate isomerase/epimerase family protein [Opitutus sp. ER46]|uniref:sugar phosphate isomerase/epimerase family protein n=1 Tax=Opitutus sp. ER46 TaxID=2161864 RepID=UPI000D2F5CBA|nr:sugar phosphate isomerase/epimerase family protein [Opitutus sp. ER46]PTX94493.1 sugar phosphate isomerase/epimerase [Opitutus sp. ER46]